MIKIDSEKNKIKLVGDSKVVLDEISTGARALLKAAAEVDGDMFNAVAGQLVLNVLTTVVAIERKYGYEDTLADVLKFLEEKKNG